MNQLPNNQINSDSPPRRSNCAFASLIIAQSNNRGRTTVLALKHLEDFSETIGIPPLTLMAAYATGAYSQRELGEYFQLHPSTFGVIVGRSEDS